MTTHWHICPKEKCGTAWEHPNGLDAILEHDEYHEAHNCPNCGTNTRQRYTKSQAKRQSKQLLDAGRQMAELKKYSLKRPKYGTALRAALAAGFTEGVFGLANEDDHVVALELWEIVTGEARVSIITVEGRIHG